VQQFGKGTPEAKLKVANSILPLLNKLPDPVLRDDYLRRVADVLSVDKAALGKKLIQTKAPYSISEPVNESRSRGSNSAESAMTLEEQILIVCIHFPELVERSRDRIHFENLRCRGFLERILEAREQGGAYQPSQWIPEMSEEDGVWLSGLLMRPPPIKPEALLEGLFQSVRRETLRKERDALKPEVIAMIEERVPKDAQKIERYNLLQAELLGSKR